jgi:hypothetical protein
MYVILTVSIGTAKAVAVEEDGKDKGGKENKKRVQRKTGIKVKSTI